MGRGGWGVLDFHNQSKILRFENYYLYAYVTTDIYVWFIKLNIYDRSTIIVHHIIYRNLFLIQRSKVTFEF